MSKEVRNSLAPPENADKENDANRKMTQGILDDETKRKEVYNFLEDDDDFEEFE